MSGPPRVEQAVNLAEELATVSQKYDMNVNKLKRQKVSNCSSIFFSFHCCCFLSVTMRRGNGPNDFPASWMVLLECGSSFFN